MPSDSWIIVDTETTGLVAPIHVVDLAAQRMRGWERDGDPFQVFLDHDVDIPWQAESVHGYSREFLSAHGTEPATAHRDFLRYAGDAPIVSFNLAYDYDQVLLPEWQRLAQPTMGTRGFCALKLTRMLVNPSPAGNYKLQSLKDHFGFPDRKAHSALGDVETVIDLFSGVLRPLAEERGLQPFQSLAGFASGEWYPEKLPFGKFAGRGFREAANDKAVMDWIVWLSRQAKSDGTTMAQWYLKQLNDGDDRSG